MSKSAVADVTGVRWTFVGAGNMATSLVGGLLGGGARTEDVTLVDPDETARRHAAERFGVATFASLAERPDDPGEDAPQGLVLAVKPDVVERACRAVTAPEGGRRPPLVVSVAAGVRLDALASWLPDGTPICRCMPNTPALLGVGATGLHASADCREEDVARAEALLATAGHVVRVPEERQLDAVTATSGSGPAYVFYLVEQMAAAGASLGLDPHVARELAIETAFGAASMLRDREAEPAELRRRVTSKGGTTAAAIAAFEAAGLDRIVLRAMRAARDRAVELGDEFAPASEADRAP